VTIRDDDGPLMGFVLLDSEDAVLWAGVSNEKGYRKSLEHNHVWILDSSTGRLLPLEDVRADLASLAELQSLRLENGSIYGKVKAAVKAASKNAETPALVSEATQELSPEEASKNQVIFALEKLIRQRKIEMPEGSYTSHLFKSGLSKIKKKTGEEAVELLLAQSREELISETADFMYHLLVLLVESDIPFTAVLDELKKR